MNAVTDLAPTVGVVAACDFLAVSRASFYRHRPLLGPPAAPAPEPALPVERASPARSLSEAEREAVLQVLHTCIRRESPKVCSKVPENRGFLPKLFASVARFPKIRPQSPSGFSF